MYQSKFTGAEVDERLMKVDNIPKKLSELENDVNYAKEEDVGDIEKKVEKLASQVDNLQGELNWIEVT